MVGRTTTRRESTGNQGVSGLHPLRRSVYHEIWGNVEFFCRSGCRNARAARVPDLGEHGPGTELQRPYAVPSLLGGQPRAQGEVVVGMRVTLPSRGSEAQPGSPMPVGGPTPQPASQGRYPVPIPMAPGARAMRLMVVLSPLCLGEAP